ncbi:MAG: hypothetical protein H6821_11510, partial [Planctomycetaceae bacterium]|nr:hypothetical protein [Planctomycetaceae bacterium]
NRPNGQSLRLLLDDIAVTDGVVDAGTEPGTVLVSDGQSFEVATGAGILSLVKVQPAGKRAMSIGEFLRGYAIPVGERLGD